MAAYKKKKRKCKPCLYLSARSNLSPLLTNVVRSLSRAVTMGNRIDDPETAYLAIGECNVFLFLLSPETCHHLFSLYELGVAVVLERPVIMIREENLLFSQLLIPPHFYETEILTRPTGSSARGSMLGTRANSRRSLGDLLAHGYQNSVISSPDSVTKCLDELLGRMYSFVSPLPPVKPKRNPVVQVSMAVPADTPDGSSASEGHSSEKLPTPEVSVPDVSVSPLCTETNYMTSLSENGESPRPVFVTFPPKDDELEPARKDADDGCEMDSVSSQDIVCLDIKAPNPCIVTPLPSPIPLQTTFYPTPLPIYPMDLSFPPLKMENLSFDKYAVAIAKTDRLPAIIRRRLMRKKYIESPKIE